MLLEQERYCVLGMDALVTVCSRKTNYGLGMDSLVTVCSRNTNVVIVWAWVRW